MHFFDPARPRLANGQVRYVNSEGLPIAALQAVTVSPKESGGFSLNVFLKRGGKNNFANFFCQVPDEAALADFFRRYLENPEEVYAKDFGYVPPEEEKELSLEDLL